MLSWPGLYDGARSNPERERRPPEARAAAVAAAGPRKEKAQWVYHGAKLAADSQNLYCAYRALVPVLHRRSARVQARAAATEI